MAMKVLHNTYNMCIRDLLDMNGLIPQACNPRALGMHIIMPMLQPLLKVGFLLIFAHNIRYSYLHCASYLVKFISFIIAFVTQFDKTIIVATFHKKYCCFKNVNAFVKSIYFAQ